MLNLHSCSCLQKANLLLFFFFFLPMALVLLLFSFIFIYFAYKFYYRLIYKLPPGPEPWPIVGNLFGMVPDFLQSIDKWSQTYGDIISVWLGCSTLNIIVSTSELAKEVLKDKDQQLAFRPRNKPVTIMSKDGKGIVWADYGPQYVKLRKICTHELFSPRSLEALSSIREYEARAMVESIFADSINNPDNYGKILLLREYLRPVVLNSVTRMVLGKRFFTEEGVIKEEGVEFKEILANEMKLAKSLFPAEHIWWLKWIFWLQNKVFSDFLARRDRFIHTIMQERQVQKMNSSGARLQFVDTLLSLQETYDLSEDDISILLWDLTIAGMETSAIAVEYAMAELVKNPRVQTKVQEELDTVIGGNRSMSESNITDLPYLQCVVKETMRLHPPVPLLLAHTPRANIKLGGYEIPNGASVYVNVRAIGRDPAVWQDPLEFRPERFLEEDLEARGLNFRLLTFGAGRRMCPGAQLGTNLVILMIGHLLQHFTWSLPEGVLLEEIDIFPGPGIASPLKKPLQVVPRIRLPANMYRNRAINV